MRLSISKEELNLLPLLQFEGRIVVIESESSLEAAVRELTGQGIIGFDTESRPSFKKGEYHPTSLVQLATVDKCFLIKPLNTGLSDQLVELFEDKKILKVGIALRDDLIDLKKIKYFRPKGFVDLNKVAKGIGVDNIGAKNLSGIFLRGRISKSQQTSNWENPVLTEAQKIYAATDAWICLRVYEKILRISPNIPQT